jgi:hypothetical protein
MPSPNNKARKRRTRQHVLADLAVLHAESFIVEEGHIAQRVTGEHGHELVMHTCDGEGQLEPGSIFLHTRAVEALEREGLNYVYDLDVADYEEWIVEETPVLVLYEASRKRAHWVPMQHYFAVEERRPKKREDRAGASRTVIYSVHRVNDIRHLKQKWAGRGWGFLTI